MKTKLILMGLCAALVALEAGCASPGAPLPPSLRLPATVNNLAAARKGSRVVLTWSPPRETTDREAIRRPTVTRVCRVVDRYPIAGCANVAASLSSGELASTEPGARVPEVSYEDVLPQALLGERSGAGWGEVTYAIEVVNQRGRSAGLSNQVRISLVPTAPPPESLRATLDAQGPVLHWTMSGNGPAGTGVSCVVRIYRRPIGASGQPAGEYVPVDEQPCRAGEGVSRDGSFQWEHAYEYKAVAVSVLQQPGQEAVEVEGDDSNTVRLKVHDIFPPAVPTGLEAVFSSVGQKPFIDLTWIPDSDSDLAGYLVFRRTGEGEFAQLTPQPVTTPAWRDQQVEPGTKYFYAVAAVDVRGNRSALSQATTEQVPAAAETPSEEP